MSYCVVRCWCCTTPCTTLYDASYIPDASGPDALYDTVRRVVRSRRVGPRRLVRRPDASYNAFPTALKNNTHFLGFRPFTFCMEVGWGQGGGMKRRGCDYCVTVQHRFTTGNNAECVSAHGGCMSGTATSPMAPKSHQTPPK